MPSAIVWGAAGTIGHAVATQLTEKGWTVLGVARDAASLDGTVEFTAEADVTDPQAVRDAVHAAGMQIGEADLYVYAIGDITSAPVAEMDSDDWHRIIDANLGGAFFTTHYSLPLLTEGAHIVYIGAVSERLRLPGLSAYGAAKAALEAFADALKKEERKKKVLVVRPGAVDTAFWEKVPMSKPKGALDPAEVARQTIEAVENGEKGTLDIT